SISAAMLALVAGESGQYSDAATLTALSGASAGFFAYNRSPASIFLGDAGSLFCGYLMACFTVLTTYYWGTGTSHLAIGVPLIVQALMVLAIIALLERAGLKKAREQGRK